MSDETAGQTATIEPEAPEAAPPVAARSTSARLARLHLRMGSLALARAELEALAGAGELDDDALLDLAEVRWRTGDLPGAGAAATACLQRGSTELLALVVAAEATAAIGRPTEARKLAGRALEQAEVPLDRIFAGMPRNPIWPHDPNDPGESDGMLFDSGSSTAAATPPSSHQVVRTIGGEASPNLWEAHGAEATTRDRATVDAGVELDRARQELALGDTVAAATRLALVLRLAPVQAPAVLDVLAGRSGPAIEVVRGDAYRLVGREIEAHHAFAAAIRSLGSPAPSERAADDGATPRPDDGSTRP